MGAVDVESGNFAYFDNRCRRLGPEHVMASGALPPGFPAVMIDGRAYWDGGLVSNTPLRHIVENLDGRDATIFQVDLFSARGRVPRTLAEVPDREKDIRMPDSTGFGDYTESGQVIPVTLEGRAGVYVHSMYLDDDAPIAGGREIWGFPKKLGSPKLRVDKDTLLGTLEYGQSRIAVGTMGYKHRAADLAVVQQSLAQPNWLLKIMPDVDCSPRVCELVEYRLEDVVLKGAWEGPAALQLFEHALAPVAALPVHQVLGGLHLNTDLTPELRSDRQGALDAQAAAEVAMGTSGHAAGDGAAARCAADEAWPGKLWEYYLQLVRVEEAFLTLKSDLAIRPIYHQRPSRIEAHVYVSFLAYCLYVTLGRTLNPHAPGLTARSALEKFAALQMVDVHLPTTDGRELLLTRYTEPERELALLLERLELTLPPQPKPRITGAEAASAV